LSSLPGHVARSAAELPGLAISVAARAAQLVGESAALVRREGPVSAAQTAAWAAVGEVWSVAGRIVPTPRQHTRRPSPPSTLTPASTVTPASTASPPSPSPAAREAGAPGVATAVADAAAADLAGAGGSPNGASMQAADLPLADFDHMTLGSLRGRLRTLSVEDLVVLRAYEEEHARRLQVITMLENRIARLRSQQNQQPS
jgi:hypothetical protein